MPATQPDAAIVVRRESGARRAERQVSLAYSEIRLPSPVPRLKDGCCRQLITVADGVEAEHELMPSKYC
jgi:hypothetical protein